MSHVQSNKPDLKAGLSKKAEVVNAKLSELLQEQVEIEPELKRAIKYTLHAPGKRVRAAIVLWCCELIAGKINSIAEVAAAAIEMVHTYSLIHDDLPAMDDDDLRRGRPSCHKAFSEATAILTGDALLTLAFEILSSNIKEPNIAARLIQTLARAGGPAGMIAGQMADMAGESSTADLETLRYIHTNKTARMFAGAAVMGAIAAGASDDEIEHLQQYGLTLGLGFQVSDDILDVSGTSEQLGKTVGKDAEQGKLTYPGVVGIDQAKRIATEYAEQAVEALNIFGPGAGTLRQFAVELAERVQ